MNGRTPIPLPQEKMFFTQSDVKLVLDCNENEAGYPGHAEGYFESNKGTVILSNQRQWKLEQPWFGANYISGVVIPVPQGGLTRQSQLKLTFNEGGAIEFTTILRSLLERIGESNEVPREYEPLPAYPSSDHDLPPHYSA
ncbi:hypothetical protein EDC96DRAFT_555145 [Choanephora cucurbitarum]|nr:hypothetical protein EDC96DRAFT_584763 [Choanephora cucurbitarum]KAI8336848.1 hypothetical protein EDC96DRAFT_555145 [Choanephora cucurbitarum]